jgi:hypothetical protein
VNIGKPVMVNQFSLSKEDVVALTDEVERSLKETVLHVHNEELDSVVKKVDLILKRRFNSIDKQMPEEFIFQQKVIDSIQNLSEQAPQTLVQIENKLDTYLDKIRKMGISDSAIADLSILVSVGELARLMLTLPVFLIGYGINVLPYYSTVYYFRNLNLFQREGYRAPKKNMRPAFFGSIAMAIGMVIFIIFYLVVASVAIWLLKSVWIGVGLLVLSYLTGLFAMRYIRWFYVFQQKWKLRKLIASQREVFASLIVERQAIVKDLMVIAG